jgi:hypothetical protein
MLAVRPHPRSRAHHLASGRALWDHHRLVQARHGIARVAQACASLRDLDASLRQAPPDSTTPAGTGIPTGVSTTTVSGSQWLLPA